MTRVAPNAVRRQLIERAAEMLARHEPVTLRAVVAGTGVSTMAVYTHFDGMPGLWRAVRQEGFTRLAERLADVRPTRDPVRDLVAFGAAYTANALANPALYRAMFDAGVDLEDPTVADAGFEMLVSCAHRARDAGRFAPGTDPTAVALRFWAFGHGLAMLVLPGVLPADTLHDHVVPVAVALFVAAGDDPDRCRRSVRAGWRTLVTPTDGSLSGASGR